MTQNSWSTDGGTSKQSLSFSGWLRIVVIDRRILTSWIVFLGVGTIYALLLFSRLEAAGLPSPADDLKRSLTAGYVGWSLFWGVPACLRFLRRVWGKLFSIHVFSPVGCVLIGPVLGLSLIALVYYPLLGGGVFHFLRRWWLSGKGAQGGVSAIVQPSGGQQLAGVPVALQPAPRAAEMVVVRGPAPEPLLNVEQRLSALSQLLEKGLISRDEHDRQRSAILDKI